MDLEKGDNSVSDLCQLLAFADAVGSRKGLFSWLVSESRLKDLRLNVQLGEQLVQLSLDGRGSWQSPDDALAIIEGSLTGRPSRIATLQTQQQWEALENAVAVQLETLLFLAYKLQLEPLVNRARKYLWSNTLFKDSFLNTERGKRLLYDVVLSTRVLDAALGSNKLGKEAWVYSLLGERCSFIEVHPSFLLKPVNLTAEQKAPHEFDAVLQRDLMGTPKGTTVKVKLDLFGSTLMQVGITSLPVELRLGSPLSLYS